MKPFRSIRPETKRETTTNPFPSSGRPHHEKAMPQRSMRHSKEHSRRREEPTNPYKNRQQRLRERRRMTIGFFVILALIAVPTLWKLHQQHQEMKALELRVEELTKKKQQLDATIQSLEEEIKKVNSNEFIEKQAHEKLGMVKKNEIVYEEEDEQSSQATKDSQNSTNSSEDSKEEQASSDGE